MLLETNDLLTIPEMAALRGLAKQSLYTFLAKTDSPKPTVTLAGIKFYLRQDADKFPLGRRNNAG